MFEYTVRLTILIKMWFDVNDNWPGEMDKLTQKQTKALASRIQRNKQVKNISKKLEKPRDQQTSIQYQTIIVQMAEIFQDCLSYSGEEM